MAAPWYEPLEAVCLDACAAAGSSLESSAVLFYLARWCQKHTGLAEPEVGALDDGRVRDMAARVAHNLAAEGSRVEALVAGDPAVWTELRRHLHASARTRVASTADEYTDEALQKIAIVLLTGTPPSQAAERLVCGPEGPRAEYVFTSPFSLWSRTVVIHHIIDEIRRESRARAGARIPRPKSPPRIDPKTLRQAHDALPELLDAVRELPPIQRSVMTLTLERGSLDAIVVKRIRELAPDLFGQESNPPVGDDFDIARRLGTTARLVAANRSAARCKLAAQDSIWALLLDALMPHRSTRTARGREGTDE